CTRRSRWPREISRSRWAIRIRSSRPLDARSSRWLRNTPSNGLHSTPRSRRMWAMRDAPVDPDGDVVITGFGLTTCLGVDAETTWRAILRGTNGMGAMDAMESPLPPGSVGGRAATLPVDFEPTLPREARYLRWA